MKGRKILLTLLLPAAALLLPACNGILGDIYDEPVQETGETVSGQLYIDASDWTKWHYIDLKQVAYNTAAHPGYNPSSAWVTCAVPIAKQENPASPKTGIYTYWYDVFGEGISKYEFRSFSPTASQPEPENWTLAVHRNNVRTNGCEAAATDFLSLDELPEDKSYLESLTFEADRWNQTDVWVVQDNMLLGLIGNQGIEVNEVLSSWLKIQIPPVPPTFSMDGRVYIIRLTDGTLGALQLSNYMSSKGTKCCLTINYKYPL